MGTKNIYLDIETVALKGNKHTNPACAQIIAINYPDRPETEEAKQERRRGGIPLPPKRRILTVWHEDHPSEKDILKKFWGDIKEFTKEDILVLWGFGTHHDKQFLINRMVKNEIATEEEIYDLFDNKIRCHDFHDISMPLKIEGSRLPKKETPKPFMHDKRSAANISKALGLPSKGSGEVVPGYFLNGETKKIEEYMAKEIVSIIHLMETLRSKPEKQKQWILTPKKLPP